LAGAPGKAICPRFPAEDGLEPTTLAPSFAALVAALGDCSRSWQLGVATSDPPLI
jgi:hypothetical protein